jgi:hypothetical protein
LAQNDLVKPSELRASIVPLTTVMSVSKMIVNLVWGNGLNQEYIQVKMVMMALMR